MHDIKWIRENAEAFDRGLNRRGLTSEAARLVSIDERRRAIIRVLESWQSRRNAASKKIGQAKATRDETAVQQLMAEVAECKTSISNLERERNEVDAELHKALAEIPNIPLDEVPDGKDADDNVEHHHFGAKRNYAFTPKQHFELGEALGQMDFETAAKLSGARFVVLKKGLARMERALGQFMLDVHTEEHGYTEVAPPLLVRDEAMYGTAQLPKFETDQYMSTEIETIKTIQSSTLDHLYYWINVLATGVVLQPEWVEQLRKLFVTLRKLNFDETVIRQAMERAVDRLEAGEVIKGREARERFIIDIGLDQSVPTKERLWLIPTAEVPLTNLVGGLIVDETELPMRLTACTPCFRLEAGAAGKDTRGMIRQHQFTKVELVSITTPEQSKDEHERMLACAEEILRRLGLHYRVVTLCTGDMGFASQKTYDIEVWLPGQNAYREISSCSQCGDFQARRMMARYRTGDRAVRHVHTLNGSGVAVGRALIAVMETYQQEDGSIVVPEVLQPYMGGMKTIEKAA